MDPITLILARNYTDENRASIPVAHVAALEIEKTPLSGEMLLKWENPSDLIVEDPNGIKIPITNFEKLRVLRKEGSYPEHQFDGTEIYEGQEEQVLDGGLDNDITYYYAVFAYSELGGYIDPVLVSDILNLMENEEGIGVEAELNIEYFSMLYDVEFTTFGADDEISGGIEATFTDYEGNEQLSTSDEDGKLTLENFRFDDYYSVEFLDTDEITIVAIETGEEEVGETKLLEFDVTMLAGGSIREKLEETKITADLAGLEYEEVTV